MIVEFNNVSMTYKPGIHALRNVSFRIGDGEFVFIIGMSGSGKSTLIKLLTCEENPTSGKVFIDDFEISHLRRSLVPFLRRNIGMIFQDFRLIQTRNVYQNVAFAMEIVGAGSDLIRHRVPMVLSTVGLRDKADMLPGQLSGGEQQRVAIARAMVNNPTLILADEPTGNLDPINSESVMALLKEINDSGTTVVVCTHDATMVNKLKRRVIEISGGHLVRDDAAGEYNLSKELQTKRGRKPAEDAHAARRRARREAADDPGASPFVRNINLKFSGAGFGLSDDPDGEVRDGPQDSPAAEDPGAAETPEATGAAEAPEATEAPEMPEAAETPEATETPEIREEGCDPEPAEAPADPGSVQRDEDEAIRIAVDYYMKQARKIHGKTGTGDGNGNRFFEFDTDESSGSEETPDGVKDDFIRLIKPRHIAEGRPPEEKG